MFKMKLSTIVFLMALLTKQSSFATGKRLGEKTPEMVHLEGDKSPLHETSTTGRRELQECEDVPGWHQWKSGFRFNCGSTSMYGFCDGSGQSAEEGTMTGNEACCACGGGRVSTLATTPSPTPVATTSPTPIPPESPTTVPTSISNGFKTECEDIPGFKYTGTNFQFNCRYTYSHGYCSYHGQSDEGTMTGNEACCDCGGGRDVLVEIVPTLAPTPSPTSVATESPTAQPTSMENLLCPRATEEMMAMEEELIRLVNEVRATKQHCGHMYGELDAAIPLQMNEELRCAARYHSKWMIENNVLSHESQGGGLGNTARDRAINAGFEGSFRGENISGHRSSARSVINGWLSSQHHCYNMMNPMPNFAGVGYVDGYWTMKFGSLF